MAEEKMVPIDTSGNSVEVTLKEETKEETKEEIPVEESNVREIIEEEEVVETKEEPVAESSEEPIKEETKEEDPYKTDDLADYSKTVKKRINNLVGRRS
jgi:DNA-directed RNA polymerase specialized sigma subunit